MVRLPYTFWFHLENLPLPPPTMYEHFNFWGLVFSQRIWVINRFDIQGWWFPKTTLCCERTPQRSQSLCFRRTWESARLGNSAGQLCCGAYGRQGSMWAVVGIQAATVQRPQSRQVWEVASYVSPRPLPRLTRPDCIYSCIYSTLKPGRCVGIWMLSGLEGRYSASQDSCCDSLPELSLTDIKT